MGTAPTVKQTKPENRKRKLNRQTKTNRSLTGGFHIPYGNGKSIKVYAAPPIRATMAPTFRRTAYGWSKRVWSDDCDDANETPEVDVDEALTPSIFA